MLAAGLPEYISVPCAAHLRSQPSTVMVGWDLAKFRFPSLPARKSGRQMVTVSPRLSSCRTLRVASRVTVPSASSSPEQATIPTLRCGG